MVYQNGGVIIVFGVRGKQEPLEESAIPLRSDSLITVLLAATCQHTGAGGRGEEETHAQKHTHTKVFTVQENAYAQRNLSIHTQAGKALLALRDYLPVSSTNHFKCHCILSDCTVAPPHPYDCAAISSHFHHSRSIFYIKQLLPAHYLIQLLPRLALLAK